jgi:hypothetical protein
MMGILPIIGRNWADESTEFAGYNIFAQAGTSMLEQAVRPGYRH